MLSSSLMMVHQPWIHLQRKPFCVREPFETPTICVSFNFAYMKNSDLLTSMPGITCIDFAQIFLFEFLNKLFHIDGRSIINQRSTFPGSTAQMQKNETPSVRQAISSSAWPAVNEMLGNC